MTIVQFRNYCLKMTGATEDFPFGPDTLVFKVSGKIFALTSLRSWEEQNARVNLKCDPQKAEGLREKYPESVLPGYHMNKKHWNSIMMHTAELTEKQKLYVINHSYELVVSKLPKKERLQIHKMQQQDD